MTLFVGQNNACLDFCLTDINFRLIKFLIMKTYKNSRSKYGKIVFGKPKVLKQVFSMGVILPPRGCKLVHRR